MKRNISELLGITDDMMFQNVMKDPANCQGLLQAILPELTIKSVEVHTQEREGYKHQEKIPVLDVWVRDDQERLYDVEMQVVDQKNLDLRARYYMYALNEDALHSGESYLKLRPAYVIFIVPFDPKGRNFKDYRFVYSDLRDKSIELHDKTEIIFLNTKGKIGNIQADLQDFYNLVNNEPTSNQPFIKQIKKSMALCRGTEGWKEHAMNTEELLDKELMDNTRDLIKRFVVGLRKSGNTDEQIYQQLIADFEDKISKEELEQLIKEAK